MDSAPIPMVYSRMLAAAAISVALSGGNFAGGIGAIGEQDHNALVLGPVSQPLGCQTHRVANGGGAPGHTKTRFVHQGSYGFKIEGEGSLHVGLGTEQDQTEPVTLAAGDKVIQYPLDRLQAVNTPALKDHVLFIHAGGDVHNQHQITAGNRHLHLLAHVLGPGQGHHKKCPHEKQQQLLPEWNGIAPTTDAGQVR